MTTSIDVALVLCDAAGAYYVIPPAVIAEGRVPEERVAELQQALGEDTAGFWGESLDPNTGNAVPGTGRQEPRTVFGTGDFRFVAFCPWSPFAPPMPH